MAKLYDAISANKWKSRILIASLFLLVLGMLIAISYMVDLGTAGILIALLVAAAYAVVGYYASDSLVLSISGAKPVEKTEFPYLCNTIDAVAIGAGVPSPKAYVIYDDAPNAFATGRDPEHSAIAVTTGLLKMMDRSELEGVIGHEMAHIKNFDTRFATITVIMVGMIAIIGSLAWRMMFFGGGRRNNDRGGGAGILMILGLVFVILAPIAAQFVRFAISRKREYLADASGVLITRHPDGLISALEKLKNVNMRVDLASDATAPLYFVNPISNKLSGLFATHPPLEDRIKELKAM